MKPIAEPGQASICLTYFLIRMVGDEETLYRYCFSSLV